MRIARPARQEAADASVAPPCAQNRELYGQELLENPPIRSKVTKAVWSEYRMLLDEVREACAGCPLFVDCLYRSVVQVDVSGYVGCTTPRERRQMRRMLGVSVPQEDLDDAAGVRVEGRPLDHDTVLATRRAYPDESFEQLADRLGCSLSTIKRHMRRARQAAEQPRTERTHTEMPSVDDVLDCFDEVVESDR